MMSMLGLSAGEIKSSSVNTELTESPYNLSVHYDLIYSKVSF